VFSSLTKQLVSPLYLSLVTALKSLSPPTNHIDFSIWNYCLLPKIARYADDGRALFNGNFKVVGHAHGKFFHADAGNLGAPPEYLKSEDA
jgi:hypothetical protein